MLLYLVVLAAAAAYGIYASSAEPTEQETGCRSSRHPRRTADRPATSRPAATRRPIRHRGLSSRASGMSNKAKFWIGVALSLPAMVVAGIVTGGGSALADALGADPQVGGIVSTVLGLLLLAAFVAAIVLDRTRWFALGILAGGAVLFILAAGACIVLLVAFIGSYN